MGAASLAWNHGLMPRALELYTEELTERILEVVYRWQMDRHKDGTWDPREVLSALRAVGEHLQAEIWAHAPAPLAWPGAVRRARRIRAPGC